MTRYASYNDACFDFAFALSQHERLDVTIDESLRSPGNSTRLSFQDTPIDKTLVHACLPLR